MLNIFCWIFLSTEFPKTPAFLINSQSPDLFIKLFLLVSAFPKTSDPTTHIPYQRPGFSRCFLNSRFDVSYLKSLRFWTEYPHFAALFGMFTHYVCRYKSNSLSLLFIPFGYITHSIPIAGIWQPPISIQYISPLIKVSFSIALSVH